MKLKALYINCIHTLWFRILFAIGVPVIGILGAWYLYRYTSPAFCVLYQLTDIYCPGCGTGRAAYDILHFHFLEALSHNILFIILLPFVGYYFIKLYIIIVFKKDLLPFFKVTYKQTLWILILILLFFIARNIPIYPFLFLAP